MLSEKGRAVRTTAEEVGLGLEGEEGFSTPLPLLSLPSLLVITVLPSSESYLFHLQNKGVHIGGLCHLSCFLF